MKKRYFITLLLIIVTTFACFVGCGEEKVFAPYDKYTGETFDLVVDDYVKIDGVLDEDIWANNKAVTQIPGAVYHEGSNELIDVSVYGERNATVYAYLGEKAIYFAFEVTDKNLYYNPSEITPLSQSTRVEFYFANTSQFAISRDCYYIKVNITNDEESGNVVAGMASYSPYNNGWDNHRNPIKTKVKAKIDGTVMEDKNDESYSTENNTGYVVEGAIDISLLGKEKDSMQFTAAFVQDSGFMTERLNNSFIPGTSYINVGTWKLMTNDGIVDDKEDFFDSQVVADNGVVIDGKLDDDIWQNAVGRTVETTKLKNSNGENKKITSYVVTTEKGLYVGMDSNDESVYYHDGMRAVYSTGAEILIAADNASTINRKTSLQWRYNVGGKGNRYYGDQIIIQDNDWETGYPWKEEFFPALCAGVVKGENPEKGMNSGKSDGWIGEIFIPWESFGYNKIDYRSQVAVMICPYSGYELGVMQNGDQKRDYLAPVTVKEYGIGSQQINPQEKWFVFKDGKPVYDGIKLDDCYLDGMNLVTINGVDYYQETISAKYYDNVVCVSGFSEIFPTIDNAQINFNDDNVIVINNGNGTYTIRIPASSASAYETQKAIDFVVGDTVSQFNVAIDADFVVDGVMDEQLWSTLNKLNTTQTSTFTTNTEFTVALREGAMYIGATVQDPNFAQFASTSPVGLELYFNFGETLSSKNTYQLRILANNTSGAKFYVYSDVALGTDKFSWVGGEVNSAVYHVFRSVSGGYELEAKIPYSLFNLSEKPENVEIAVFTKFIKNVDSKVTATKFFTCEGNQYSRNQALYLNFDETGYSPNKVYMLNEVGNQIDEINFVDGVNVINGKYEGSIKLFVTQEQMLITDASFGAYNQYFDKTNASNGVYKYAIPTTLFENASTISIPVTSSKNHLNAQIKFNNNELTTLYLRSNSTSGKVNLWPINVVSLEGVDNYAITIEVFVDENYLLPLDADKKQVTFDSSEIQGITTTNVSNNIYTVYVPVNSLTVNQEKTITATVDNVTGSIVVVANALSDTDKTTLISNTSLFLNFDNGTIDNAIASNPDPTMRRGNAQISDGVYTANQAQRALEVQGITLGNTFTVSMLVNGSDIKNTITNHYSNELFTTGNVDGKKGYFTDGTTPFSIRVKSNMLHIKMGVKENQIYINSALSSVGDGFERWTFTVNRTKLTDATDEVEVIFYINGVQIASGKTTINSTHNFNNVDNLIGLGAPARYDDVVDPMGYVSSGDNDTVQRHNIRIDNVLIYDGMITTTMMNAIDGYSNQFA